jgi:hypothetical protein
VGISFPACACAPPVARCAPLAWVSFRPRRRSRSVERNARGLLGNDRVGDRPWRVPVLVWVASQHHARPRPFRRDPLALRLTTLDPELRLRRINHRRSRNRRTVIRRRPHATATRRTVAPATPVARPGRVARPDAVSRPGPISSPGTVSRACPVSRPAAVFPPHMLSPPRTISPPDPASRPATASRPTASPPYVLSPPATVSSPHVLSPPATISPPTTVAPPRTLSPPALATTQLPLSRQRRRHLARLQQRPSLTPGYRRRRRREARPRDDQPHRGDHTDRPRHVAPTHAAQYV